MSSPESSSAARSAEIPVHLTRFVGRDHELDVVGRLLGATRLLTLTGAGGSGKTRLAAELVARARPAYARVGWVDLAALADDALVAPQAAAALRAPERPGVSAVDALLAAVGAEPTLLVLDNCEHLVDACAGLAETLLRGCPRLTVLTTSRAALGVASETAWLVPPLDGGEAVQLFVERAQASLPTFALTEANADAVREICGRLDGIPLAIELAAARVRVLSPERIAERLDDAFRLLTSGSRTALPRHRTLRGTMDWSHELLAGRERTLFRRLAVFVGGFSLEAAEAVCVDPPSAEGTLEAEDILDGVAALVDKSLVVMDAGAVDGRYRLLETVRQYAEERLREAGELDALRRAHAEHFVAWAEAAEPRLFAGAGDPAWVARVQAESGNLRALAAWAEEEPSRNDALLRLCAAINWFWFATGQFREARQRLTLALARAADCSAAGVADADPLLRGRALVALAYIATWQGDHAAVRAPAEESVRLLRGRCEPAAFAAALVGVCSAHVLEGDGAAAGCWSDEALAVARPLPPHALHSLILYWHGWAAQLRGDVALARASFEEAVANGRRVGHRPAVAHPLAMLGRLASALGDHDEAFARYVESLEIHGETEDTWGIAITLEGLAAVAVARGQFRRAARIMAAADSLRVRIAAALTPADRAEHARLVERVRAALGDGFARVWEEGRTLAIPDTIRLAVASADHQTAEHRIVAPPPAPAARPDAGGLRVLALGPLQAFRAGAPIDAAAWGSARTRELLVFLLVHPDGVTKEQVGLALWPEASTAQLRNSFHVTLHRLRKALGTADWIAPTNDRYRVDPAAILEFDVAEFDRELAAARRALRRREEGATALLERALARYRGDFLDGEPAGDWHLEHRDRLQRLYVDALMELGARYAADERLPKAADAYRRVLARDDLHEDALRALITCHGRLGERSQALRLYQRFADRLRDELDADPQPETRSLVERIQHG